MASIISIRAGTVVLRAELNDSPTAKAVGAALPIRGAVRTWGDEIYFTVPVDQPLEAGAAEVVEVGDVGYWPTGKAFCVFFGRTPASRGDEIRPASAVNLIGRVLGDATQFKSVGDGESITLKLSS